MSKSKSFEKNLSEGSVLKQLLIFSLPFLLSNIIQSLYNVADMFIVGNFAGTVSMSGVNIGGQITLILTNFVVGLCTGGTVLIAQYIGSKDKEAMEESVATLMTILFIASIALTAIMLIFKTPLLHLINTPAESFQESSNYLTITVIGIIFIFAYNVFSAIMRGMGDSRRPFIYVLIACITNIGLDLILVAGFKMGATGAAIATVVSQALSVILCIISMIKNGFVFDFKPSSFKLHADKVKKILMIGLPSAVQNGVVSLSFLIITALVNTIGGVNASAAVGVVGKFNGFAIMPGVAMGVSISTIAAQNIGANKWHRAIHTCKLGTLIAVAISYTIFALVQMFPESILRIFNDDAEMIHYGVTYIRSFSFDYLLVPICFCINGLFIANGHTTFSLINGLLSSILLRVPASYLFGSILGMGIFGVGVGAPIASAGSLILILGYLISGKWKTNLIKEL